MEIQVFEFLFNNSRMTETAITSRDNPLFKRLKKLAESARARREARMTLLDGEHLLAAYLDAGGQPHTLVRAASFDAGRFEQWRVRCPAAKAVALPDALFDELTPVATPTGLLAEGAWLSPIAPEGTPLIIALEDIQDPGNLGSMLRTAAAAGATRAVLSKGCHHGRPRRCAAGRARSLWCRSNRGWICLPGARNSKEKALPLRWQKSAVCFQAI